MLSVIVFLLIDVISNQYMLLVIIFLPIQVIGDCISTDTCYW